MYANNMIPIVHKKSSKGILFTFENNHFLSKKKKKRKITTSSL